MANDNPLNLTKSIDRTLAILQDLFGDYDGDLAKSAFEIHTRGGESREVIII
jgi:hypothetical protein